MYELCRLIIHNVKKTDDWVEHTIRKSSTSFLLTNQEFDFLFNLPKEYKYVEFDNEFYIDRHPSILRENIENMEFVDDYEEHLTDKFFVLYEYKEVDDV